jgi:DNA-binding XRE family transcriptional regulator
MTKNTNPPVSVHFNPDQVRERLGITKGQFATMIGVSANGYSRMCGDPTQVRVVTLAKLISSTGCEISDLFQVKSAK